MCCKRPFPPHHCPFFCAASRACYPAVGYGGDRDKQPGGRHERKRHGSRSQGCRQGVHADQSSSSAGAVNHFSAHGVGDRTSSSSSSEFACKPFFLLPYMLRAVVASQLFLSRHAETPARQTIFLFGGGEGGAAPGGLNFAPHVVVCFTIRPR